MRLTILANSPYNAHKCPVAFSGYYPSGREKLNVFEAIQTPFESF